MRRSTPIVLLAILVAALLARWPNLRQPVNRDISAYATIGARMHHGDWPYRDVFDHKQPLIYGIMWFLQWIAPRSNVAIQVTAAVIPALGGMALFLLLAPLAGSAAAAASALLFVTLGATRIFEGTDLNTEHVLSSVACLAVLWPLSLRRPVTTAQAGFIGLLGALATMSKAVGVFILPALLLAMVWDVSLNRKRVAAQLSAFAGGLLFPWLALAFVYWLGGGFSDFYAGNISYNLTYVASLQRHKVFFNPALNSLLVLGAAILTCRLTVSRGRDRVAWTVLLWLAGATAGAKIGRGDFPHYFAPMVPPALVAACLPLCIGGQLWPRALNAVRAAALAAVSLPLLYDIAAGYQMTPQQLGARMFGGQSVAWNYQKRVGAWLRAHSNADDTLFVAGAEPGFYWQSSLRPATRYLYDYPSRLIPGVKEEMMQALMAKPPRFVVLPEPAGYHELPWLHERYDRATKIGPVQVFELRPQPDLLRDRGDVPPSGTP